MDLCVLPSLDATLQDVGEGGPSGGEVVEHLGLLVEDDMEVPASAERTDGGFDSETLSGNNLDPDRTVGAFWVGGGDAGSVELLVGWVDHFVLNRELAVNWRTGENYTHLFREVDPELQTYGVWPAVLMNWHLSMDNLGRMSESTKSWHSRRVPTSFASGHPLDSSRFNSSMMTGRVLVSA